MFNLYITRVLAVVLLLALAWATWWLQRSVNPPAPVAAYKQRHDPDYIMENFTSSVLDNSGALKYRLKAERMAHFPDDDSTEIEQPVIMIYRDDEQVWNIASERGIARDGGKEVLLAGKVNIRRLESSREGPLEVQTRDVTIIPDRDLGQTSQPVTIRNEQGKTRAVGMRIHIKEERLELLSRVKSVYEDE